MLSKFSYSMGLTAISSMLERIASCSGDQVGRLFVPQIIQTTCLKTLTQNTPQAVLQLISFIRAKSFSTTYLVSFIMSIKSLLSAFYAIISVQPSICNAVMVQKVFYIDYTSYLVKKEEPTKQQKKHVEIELPASATPQVQTEYEKAIEELKKNYTREGKIEGYYIQRGKKGPIVGEYTMVEGEIKMTSVDIVGKATWDGQICIFNGKTKIAKRYDGANFVAYDGYVNQGADELEVEGNWSIEKTEGLHDAFKMTFYKGPNGSK